MLTLGDIEISVVSDGRFALDGGAMFGVVPKALWQRRIPADERNRIPMGLNCLLLRCGSRLVLVDTGIGERWDDKQRDIYAIDHSQTDLLHSLQACGVQASQITDVILTHLHFDHAGGVVRDGSTGPELTFPRATHHIQRRHLKWAEHASDKDRASFLPADMELLARSGRLHLLDGDVEIFDGVDVLVSEGHTVAQQLVRVSGGGRTVMYCGDIIPTSAHIPLPWVMGYDLYPLTTIEEKKTILAQAVEEGWILALEHDPELQACTVREESGAVVVDAPCAI